MYRSLSVVISLLLLCLLFIPIDSTPPSIRNGRNKSNRQKRTFGLGLLGSRDWSPFYQSWRVPMYTTMPSYVHVVHEDNLYVSILKKISDLEINQNRIMNYLQQLTADKNANPCGETRMEPVTPQTKAEPQLPVDAGVLYQEPGTDTLTTDVTSTSSSSTEATSSEEAEMQINQEMTMTPGSDEMASVETSSSEERDVSVEPDIVTIIPTQDETSDEEVLHMRIQDFTDRNDVL